MLDGRIAVIASARLLDEYERTLWKPRLAKLHGLTGDEIRLYVAHISLLAELRDPGSAKCSCPDPRDQHLWDLLESGPDVVLVTGELALLRSEDFPDRVVSPREFVERFLQ